MSFFSLFCIFVFRNLVRSSSPKPQKIEIEFLGKVAVELQTQFCLPKCFGATPPETSKNQFFENLNYENIFFLYQ